MLLQAVCTEGYTLVNRGFGPTCRGPVIIPLVSDHLWTRVLTSYPYNRLKVLVEKRPTLQRYIPNCWECESTHVSDIPLALPTPPPLLFPFHFSLLGYASHKSAC